MAGGGQVRAYHFRRSLEPGQGSAPVTRSPYPFLEQMTKVGSLVPRRELLGNDPSAGSPTETLLRLLLPLSIPCLLPSENLQKAPLRPHPQNTQSVVATGGVYKGQGRNQRMLMTRAY